MIRAVDATVRISLVPNGVDLDAFRRREPIPDEGPLRLLCVGRLIERKGQQHLIEAVKRLSDEGIELMLDLVGTGDAATTYEARVRQLGLEDHVHLIGYVPREEIAQHYVAAHVFVLPSYNEGMSVATLEAMAAGLPVVITRTGGTAELVEEGVNGLTFEWGNVDLLVGHLHRLATDRGCVRAMGQASQARAASFTWETATRCYQELFAALTQPGARQCPGLPGREGPA
jgi:phosphatidylinositol alpha-1,6-mannosyltransferase